MIRHGVYPCPLGLLIIGCTERKIVSVKLASEAQLQHTPCPLSDLAARQLLEYFDGRRRSFELPLHPAGTPFQQAVWQTISQIPYGETATYGQIAAMLRNPKASRAVGQAANRNPLWIIVPCHRVVGKNQALTGYAGGLETKQALLKLEQNNA